MDADRSLSWTVEQQGAGRVRVVLRGDMNENTDLGELLGALTAQQLAVFDLEDVRSINPPGAREWLQFIDGMRARSISFELERCSVAVVHEMHQTSNFRGTGRVVSIFAPYYCSECETAHTMLIELEPKQAADDEPCPKCGSPMESSAQTLLLHLPSLNLT